MLAYDIQENFLKTVDQSKIKVVKHELQYDFFLSEEESEVERLVRIVDEIRLSSNKVRKKLFAEQGAIRKTLLEKNSSLEARVLELEERLQHIEKGICNGNILVCR